MTNEVGRPTSAHDDDIYLRVWDIEQKHQVTRWTVVIFFLSVSFAVFGLSFNSNLTPPQTFVVRLSGLMVFWFAFAMLLHFYRFTREIRQYLIDMEEKDRTSLRIQSRLRRTGQKRSLNKYATSIWLVGYLGIFYTFVFLLLTLLNL